MAEYFFPSLSFLEGRAGTHWKLTHENLLCCFLSTHKRNYHKGKESNLLVEDCWLIIGKLKYF